MFGERLKELMEDKGLTYKDISNYFNLNYNSLLYKWLKNKNMPRIETVIQLADYFECSLDYILGKTDNFEKIMKRELPAFGVQLKKILADKKITQYKLIKDTKFNKGHLYAWISKNEYPSVENIIILADFLGVSVDYLVGRT